MNDMTNAIINTVSISSFNKGLAGQIFDDVKKSGAKVVIKNNNPECVLMSPAEYLKLMNEINDARLLLIANERLAKHTDSDTLSEEEMLKRLNVSPSALTDFDKVELE